MLTAGPPTPPVPTAREFADPTTMKRHIPAASDHPNGKVLRTTASSDEGGAPASSSSRSYEDGGVTVRGLRALAAGSEGRSVREMWRNVWLHETVAVGWTVSVTYDANDTWVSQVYHHTETGETVEKDSHSRRGAPEGCLSVLESRADLAEEMGIPTHFVSYPWRMPFQDIVEAIEAVLRPGDIVYFDTLARNYHTQRDVQNFARIESLAEGKTPLVQVQEFKRFLITHTPSDSIFTAQVCSRWDDPERLNRLWMIVETSAAVAGGADVILALTADQREAMGNALLADGPSEILQLIYEMEIDPANGGANRATDRAPLIALVEE